MKIINKLVFAILLTFTFSHSTLVAQIDTMYVMKNGAILGKFNIRKDVDSVIFYQPGSAPNSGKFTDTRDNNVYNWVKLGSQIWMAENLRYLPSVVGQATGSQTAPYYYVYDYNGTSVASAKATANYTTYGVLYNWTAAMASSPSSNTNPSGVRGVCPTGWHLPSDTEWTQLTNCIDDESFAGGKLKETGTTHWYTPNAGATNETGFTALPGGSRDYNGGFRNVTYDGYYWTATQGNATFALYRRMSYNLSTVYRDNHDKAQAFSVRCIRD